MFSLKNRLIIISGASSGIGHACAVACAKRGARLALFGRNDQRLSDVVMELEGEGHEFFSFDITITEKLEAVLNKIYQKMGSIDGFIHSAGIQKTLPLKLTNSKVFLEQYQVNVIAGFDVCRILQRKKYWNIQEASIVFIASINGVIGAGAQVAYSASKGAIISGVRSLAVELSSQKIRVNSISPGMVERTQMTESIVNMLSSEWEIRNKAEYPLGWVEAEDVANTAVFLLSQASKRITGSNIIVDGGFSIK